jgi:hypothetical protein
MQTVGQLTLFCALLIHFSGCGGQTPGRTGDGGLQEESPQCSTYNTLPLASLTAEQKGILCDCVSAIGGGYAQSKPCGDAGDYVSTAESQSACVAGLKFKPDCTATFGDAFQCGAEIQQCMSAAPHCPGFLSCILTGTDTST